ncbi:MAG: hypothetical protein VX278_14510 [Myxococcota bacterium]|nr:hypothetical protein [Myxococcota bacterium]
MFTILLIFGCMKKPANTDTDAAETEEVETRPPYLSIQNLDEQQILEQVDMELDNVVDIWNYKHKREGQDDLIYEKHIDINRDGIADSKTYFDSEGKISREEIDSNFDEKTDIINYYQSEQRVSSQLDTNFDGNFDIYRYYENEVLRRREQDTDYNGKVDLWQYIDEYGQVKKWGRDIDGDGIMDTREE